MAVSNTAGSATSNAATLTVNAASASLSVWDEVCRVERRGRPRGTGRPKNQILQQFP